MQNKLNMYKIPNEGWLPLRKPVKIHRIAAIGTQEIFQMLNRGQTGTK